MVNTIWLLLIVLSILYSIFSGNIFLLNDTMFKSCQSSLELVMKMFPIIALWLGIMKIAENSGLLKKISKLLYPILHKIFPEIPREHESCSLIVSNIVANLFGLGSAATPFGLKAMESLQKLNNKKDTASRSMITFLVINTSGLTLIPTTVISLRIVYQSKNPTSFVFVGILATLCSTLGGLLIDYLLARRSNN